MKQTLCYIQYACSFQSVPFSIPYPSFSLAAAFMLISVATFADRYAEWFQNRDAAFGMDAGKLGWAFGVAACSLCLTFAATGLLLIEMLFGEEV